MTPVEFVRQVVLVSDHIEQEQCVAPYTCTELLADGQRVRDVLRGLKPGFYHPDGTYDPWGNVRKVADSQCHGEQRSSSEDA